MLALHEADKPYSFSTCRFEKDGKKNRSSVVERWKSLGFFTPKVFSCTVFVM